MHPHRADTTTRRKMTEWLLFIPHLMMEKHRLTSSFDVQLRVMMIIMTLVMRLAVL